ncbi:MAG: two-component sensor histidine kinase [Chitinivibrionales bacterium]|nr:two-component sensor histidine kinase [Chitinivibrionales bacterium]MBD3396836.1 two-component sensor histidine kinase [Chitinivibrionales bacterium]
MKGFLNRLVRAPRLYMFFMKISPFSGRYLFLVVCILGLIWYAVYTKYIIGRLEEDATSVTRTYAELIRAAISEQMSYEQINVVFERIIRDSDIPIVVTDTAGVPTMWKNIVVGPFYSRREIAPDDTSAEARRLIRRQMKRFRRSYEPKELTLSETNASIGYLIYGDSLLIRSLSWIPYLEIALVAAFGVFVYLALHNIRITERSNLWVGLAKETAHQLGTPISSLMGWVEYMRSVDDPEGEIDPQAFMGQLQRICDDMENDLNRLRTITNRFSQIGSAPALTPHDVNAIIEDAMKYFRKRLPLLGKHIQIRADLHPIHPAAVNRDLLEWVFENLFKNSVDAIKNEDGLIEVRTEYIEVDKMVRVYHSDNGKGISWEDQKKVFSPGYTTKKRGWGLGLTLAKRIIEDYHRGRIYVSWSQKGRGTVFCIDLPASTAAGAGKSGAGGPEAARSLTAESAAAAS